jgi:hypothetical protein
MWFARVASCGAPCGAFAATRGSRVVLTLRQPLTYLENEVGEGSYVRVVSRRP